LGSSDVRRALASDLDTWKGLVILGLDCQLGRFVLGKILDDHLGFFSRKNLDLVSGHFFAFFVFRSLGASTWLSWFSGRFATCLWTSGSASLWTWTRSRTFYKEAPCIMIKDYAN